jgi:lactate 2-monooxygenase
MKPFKALDLQRQIYLEGLSGKKPVISPDWNKLEQAAVAKMSPYAASYIVGGAGNQETVANNRSGFSKYRIVPKMLQNVDIRDASTSMLGVNFPSPFWLCPIGVAEMVHPDADLATARAAAKTGIPFVFSNQASVPMEEAAAAMGDSPRYFQLYWSRSRDLVASFVQRAEACGCKGIVLTLDTTLLGWRTRDLDAAFLPFLQGKGIAQFTSDPVFQKLMDESLANPADDFKPKITFETLRNVFQSARRYPGSGSVLQKLRSGRPMEAVKLFTRIYTNPAITWDDLSFLREHTSLPIFLKGILHPENAKKAVDLGINGLVVSNHGGRQVDGSISAIEALPKVVEAVGGQIPIVMDSGIRGGADVFKALALGATAVGLGRPYIYGLTLAGEKGIHDVIQHLMADFELTMALSGCKNVGEITRECLAE